nr:uncharacterized protein LOC113709996 [Coffea arabica]
MVNQQGQGQVQHPGNHEGEDHALERLQKFLPPKFLGGPSPDIAESWLERMLDIFASLGYSEERQIAFAVFQFEGAARAWWNVIQAKWDREQTPWTCANFTREFNEKYLPPLVQERLSLEFHRIREMAHLVGMYKEIEMLRNKVEVQKRLAEYWEERWKHEYSEKIELLHENIGLKRQCEGILAETLARPQINTFTEVQEKSQRLEISGAQVKALHAKKRGALSDIQRQEQGDPGACVSLILRVRNACFWASPPMEFVILLGHGGQWGGNGAKVFDKTPVEACQPKKAVHLRDGCRSWPLLDGFNLGLIHFDPL